MTIRRCDRFVVDIVAGVSRCLSGGVVVESNYSVYETLFIPACFYTVQKRSNVRSDMYTAHSARKYVFETVKELFHCISVVLLERCADIVNTLPKDFSPPGLFFRGFPSK
jgi:TRAP-type mannitol/chloroaromatic compound transport system permease small subunit